MPDAYHLLLDRSGSTSSCSSSIFCPSTRSMAARSFARCFGSSWGGRAAFMWPRFLDFWARRDWLVWLCGCTPRGPCSLPPTSLLSCWGGFKSARAMVLLEKLPRREGFTCPSCGAHPPIGPLWKCAQCQQTFDTFQSMAICPHCGAQFPNTMCGECQKMSPIGEWAEAADMVR